MAAAIAAPPLLVEVALAPLEADALDAPAAPLVEVDVTVTTKTPLGLAEPPLVVPFAPVVPLVPVVLLVPAAMAVPLE